MNDEVEELIDFCLEFALGHVCRSPNINIKRGTDKTCKTGDAVTASPEDHGIS
jgi:hypothetical protein